MEIALPNTLVDVPLFLNAAVDECDIFFVFPTLAEEQLNELSPAPTTLRALRELFDFDVRKSSAAFVTRSVLVRLEIVLPSYDVDATRFDAILVLALAESCDAEADIAFRKCFSSSLLHSQTRRAPLKFEQKLHQPHSHLFALPLPLFPSKTPSMNSLSRKSALKMEVDASRVWVLIRGSRVCVYIKRRGCNGGDDASFGGLFFRRFQIVRRWAILFACFFISFAGVVVHTSTNNNNVFFDLLRL